MALGAAIDFINSIGIEAIEAYENHLHQYAMSRLRAIPGMRFIGDAQQHSSVISFLVDSIHPFDMGMFLDKMGIAVRTGHHCAQPLMQRFDIAGTVRASFALYNTTDEVDILVAGIQKVKQVFG